MRIQTTVRVSLMALALTFAFAAPALASAPAGSVLSSCTFTVTGTVAPGNTVSVEGSGFQPDADLPISVNDVVVATVTIQNGGVLPPTNIDIPSDAEFPITISIPCGAGPGSSTATETFTEPSGGESGLAFTGGSNTGTYVGIGLGALALGWVLIVGTRRRNAVRARSLDA